MKGPAMTGTVAAITIAIFTIGIVAGVITIVSIGIKREERNFRRTGRISMTRLATDRVSVGARSLTGLYVGERTDLEPTASRYGDSLV
jgi:hypothetical protein